MRQLVSRTMFALLLGLVGLSTSQAQSTSTQPDPYAARIMMGPESYTWQSARGNSAIQGRTAQSYYGGTQAAAVAQNGPVTKPFNTIVNEPTISPYMNLYREQTAVDIPNYQLFVRPQQEQLESNRRQQTAVSNLQRQIQQTSYNAPTTGRTYSTAARFGDTRQYYGGFTR